APRRRPLTRGHSWIGCPAVERRLWRPDRRPKTPAERVLAAATLTRLLNLLGGRIFEMQRDVVLTKQGLKELKNKIEFLSNERRREVAQRIKEAREFGDISENSEYDYAKNEQAMLERQIAELEDKLR